VFEETAESKPPKLKVVSENLNAPDKAGRDIAWARDRAKRALAELAATILRTMAGSETASYEIVLRLGQLIDAQNELHNLSGVWLSFEDERNALILPQSDLEAEASDDRYAEWQRNRGMERIVQGALCLAAHQVLDERPNFGGKYSVRLIEDGIASIERAFSPPRQPSRRQKGNS
jgi:hypothetical protein